MKLLFFKKPSSTNITSYRIQKTSLLSILHRFSSIFLTLIFLIFLIFFSFSNQLNFYFIITNYFIFYILIIFLITFSLIFGVIHIIDGFFLTSKFVT